MSQKHNFIMVGKVAVTNSNPSGPHDSIDQSIGAVAERAMIDPDLLRTENGNPIAVRSPSVSDVSRRRSDVGVPRRLAMVDVDVVYDHVRHVLQSHAPVSRDVNVGAAAVDGLVRVENELVFQLDDHVGREDDPKGFVLDDGVAESARFGVRRVVVGGIGDGVDPAAFAA